MIVCLWQRHLNIRTYRQTKVHQTVDRQTCWQAKLPPINATTTLQLDKSLLHNRLLRGVLRRGRESLLRIPTIRTRSLLLGLLPDWRQLRLLRGRMLPVRLLLLLLLRLVLLWLPLLPLSCGLHRLRGVGGRCLCRGRLVGVHRLLQVRVGRVRSRLLRRLRWRLRCGLRVAKVVRCAWVGRGCCADRVWC